MRWSRALTSELAENGIVGEALIALKHDELKEMGINSVGHRLTILKTVYEIKSRQNVPLDVDHYIPLCMAPVLFRHFLSPLTTRVQRRTRA